MRRPVFLKELFFLLFFVALGVAALGASATPAESVITIASAADGS